MVDCIDSPTRYFIHTLIDWNRVRRRLERYPAIRSAFPESTLKESSDKPPFYCHYMAWRLGTWDTESHFANLESLLGQAKKLKNWEYEHSLLTNGAFGTFWSLVWQMQVAARLREVGDGVRWSEPSGGPDLSVRIRDERWFVECYSIQKSYGPGLPRQGTTAVRGSRVPCTRQRPGTRAGLGRRGGCVESSSGTASETCRDHAPGGRERQEGQQQSV